MALDYVRNVTMPYCLKRISGNEYVFLNRDYKPLGQCTQEFVDYAPHRMQIHGLGPKMAAKISCHGSTNLDDIFLYDDGCQPENSAKDQNQYFNRLALLMKLKVTPPEVWPMR